MSFSPRHSKWIFAAAACAAVLLSGCVHKKTAMSAPPRPKARATAPLEAATIACAATPASVRPGQQAEIDCQIASALDRGLSVAFSSSAGTITGDGLHARLDTSEVAPGTILVHASATDSHGTAAATMVAVRVLAPAAKAAPEEPSSATPRITTAEPPPPAPPEFVAPTLAAPVAIEETGREFLYSGEQEKPGYGLYSYLLWPADPLPADRPRYLRIITAFLSISTIQVEQGLTPGVDAAGHPAMIAEAVAPEHLNIAYIPVSAVPPANPDANWVLDHYDTARARILLKRVPKTRVNPSGPYIISVLHPMHTMLGGGDHYLYQNLSSRTITDELAYRWIQIFQQQASSQDFSRPNIAAQLVLHVRDQIGALADITPAAKAGLATWIQWLGPSTH